MPLPESFADQAKAILDSLQSATKWLAGIVVAAALAALTTGNEVRLLGASMQRGDAAFLSLCCLGGVMAYLLRQFLVLQHLIHRSGGDREAVTATLKTHQWPMNPFTETGTPRWYFTDVCGVALLAGTFCLGFLAWAALLPPGRMVTNDLLMVGGIVSFVVLGWSWLAIADIVWTLRGSTKVFAVKLTVVLALIVITCTQAGRFRATPLEPRPEPPNQSASQTGRP